jgi:hypothetical protein
MMKTRTFCNVRMACVFSHKEIILVPKATTKGNNNRRENDGYVFFSNPSKTTINYVFTNLVKCIHG